MLYNDKEKAELEKKSKDGVAKSGSLPDSERPAIIENLKETIERIVNRESAGFVFVGEKDKDDEAAVRAIAAIQDMSKFQALTAVVNGLDMDVNDVLSFVKAHYLE